MIELGTVELAGRASVISMRSRIRSLALALHAPPVVATRLAMITSETARSLLRNAKEPRIGVSLEVNAARLDLVLRFGGWSSVPQTGPLERFFEAVAVTEDGELALVARAGLGAPSVELDAAFLEEQRRLLLHRSRTELMRDIQSQNTELERHRHRLEDIVQERTSELHSAQQQAEQANQAKSQFLSSMSHELRTPLNGVLGYAQILQQDRTLTQEQRDSLDAIANCGRHLLTLINDVLDLSKIEAGRMEVRLEACHLERLVRSVYDIARPRAEAKGLSFRVDSAPDLATGIQTDTTKLKQVLVNLLGNSIKFTERGEVRLAVERSGDRLCFEVSDTGIGMTPEEQSHVFDPFKQAEGGHQMGGTGLGLAISQRIVENLGGSIALESEKGKGSTFRVELPLVEVEVDEAAATDDSMLSGEWNLRLAAGAPTTILVADDNRVNRDILVRLLEDVGFGTLQAADGREALEAMRTHRPPLALLDIRMPVMSGIDAARAIREDPEIADAKLIGVSADVLSSLKDELDAAGFDAFLSKPVSAGEVFRAIEAQLGLEFEARDEPGEEPSGETRVPGEADLSTVPLEQRQAWAERIRDLVAMGDVAQLAEVAGELRSHAGAAPLGNELDRLAGAFELDAIEVLSQRLEGDG